MRLLEGRLWKGGWCDVVGVTKGIDLHASMYSEQRIQWEAVDESSTAEVGRYLSSSALNQ